MSHVRSKVQRLSALCTVSALAFTASNVALAQTMPKAQMDGQATNFNIPAQPLGEALAEYAEQADVLILASADATRGKRSAGISGLMTASAALDALLDGQGLRSDHRAGGAIAISSEQGGDSDSGNVGPAPILMAQNPTSSTQTTNSRSEEGGSHDSPENAEEVTPLEEIIVTGTNIRGVENPTTPVLQFDREYIQLSGASTVEDFLRVVPQNYTAITPLASNSENDFASDTGLDGVGVDLRGLGAGSTLTLLNGRRMTASGNGSSVDVSLLPLAVIDRIDIQTDGASAVYGSDAVAGVVNFITRKDFEGFEVNGRYGSVTNGSKEEYGFGATGGLSWNSGSALLSVDYLDQTPLRISERNFVDLDSVANRNGTFGIGSERLSLFASANQSLTPKLDLSLDAMFTDRESSSVSNSGGFDFVNNQQALYTNTRVNYQLAASVSATLFYDYSEEDGSSTRTASPDAGGSTINFTNSLQTIEGLISGAIATLPSGEKVSFALGVAYREERFDQDTVSFAERPKRDVATTYAELILPLVGDANSVPLISALDLSMAGRFEDYSDFGETFNPKIGVSWEFDDQLRLVASYSESFRAPNLLQLFTGEIALQRAFPTSFITGFTPPPQSEAAPDGQTILLLTGLGGNPELTEETADVVSAGAVLEPNGVPGLAVSISYFNVAYDDRVEQVNFFDILQGEQFETLVDVPPNSQEAAEVFSRATDDEIQFFNLLPGSGPEDAQVLIRSGFQNLALRDVEGIDFIVDYHNTTNVGEVFASVNATYMLDYETQLTENSPIVDQLDTLYRPLGLRIRGAAGWSRDAWSIFGAINYSGGYDTNANSEGSLEVGSWTTVDLGVSYVTQGLRRSVLEGASLSVNVQNIFNEDPPFVQTFDGLNFDTSNADPYKRYISIALRKSF